MQKATTTYTAEDLERLRSAYHAAQDNARTAKALYDAVTRAVNRLSRAYRRERSGYALETGSQVMRARAAPAEAREALDRAITERGSATIAYQEALASCGAKE